MEMSNLSSNWKKIQKSLKPKAKPENPASILGKRKAATEKAEGTKRLKSAARPSRGDHSHRTPSDKSRAGKRDVDVKRSRRSHMGLWSSKPVEHSAASPDEPAHDMVNRAAIEDVPASQLGLVRKPSAVSLRSFKDTINGGIIPGVAVGRYVAIDCEMVGVGPNPEASSALARVSMVNYHGEQVYDSFVATKEAVTDYRTYVSGITAELLESARSFEQVQEDVAALLDGRILVGHAVRHDLKASMLGHPMRDIRDTSRHKAYKEVANGRTPGLKRLAREILGVDIQAGEHSSIEDARATMMLYKRDKNSFEREHVRKFGVDRRQTRPEAIDGEAIGAKQGLESSKVKSGKKKRRKR